MQIKNKLFPYPVLNSNASNSTYFNKEFKLCFTEERTKDFICLKDVHFETTSQLLSDLYHEGKVGVACIVEGSKSVYRRWYEITENKGNTIKLCANDFNGKVEISIFAYAKKEMIIGSREFSEDYRRIAFKIDKYDIMAVDDGVTVIFDHKDEEETFAKSIFSITINEALNDDDAYSVSYDEVKINIYLSRKQFDDYHIVFKATAFKEVFFNMLLVPVLTEAFTMIKRDLEAGEDFDDICCKYSWFFSVKAGYKKMFGSELSKEKFLEFSPVVMAQELLGKPLSVALKNIVEIINDRKEGYDE